MPIKFRLANSISVHPAYNNTFIIHSWDILHVYKDGNIIKEYNLTK